MQNKLAATIPRHSPRETSFTRINYETAVDYDQHKQGWSGSEVIRIIRPVTDNNQRLCT